METIECKLKLLLPTYLLLKELSCRRRPQIGMTVTWIDEDGRWILDGQWRQTRPNPQSLVILRKNNEDDNTIINSSQTKPCSSLSLSASLSVASCCFRHFYSRQCSALPDKIQTCPTPFHYTDNSEPVRSQKTNAMLVALNCEELCEIEMIFMS